MKGPSNAQFGGGGWFDMVCKSSQYQHQSTNEAQIFDLKPVEFRTAYG